MRASSGGRRLRREGERGAGFATPMRFEHAAGRDFDRGSQRRLKSLFAGHGHAPSAQRATAPGATPANLAMSR